MEKSAIDKIMAPVSRFIHLEYTSGIVLLVSVVIAIVWANSGYHDFYEHLWHINFSIGIGCAFLLVLLIGNIIGIRSSLFYLLIGLGAWIGFLLSGVHATIAGVLVAFTIPAVTKIDEQIYSNNLRILSYDFETDIPERGSLITSKQNQTIQKVKTLSMAAETPLQTIEHTLHPWVAFVIMPLFALANAGIVINSDFFTSVINPVSIGVALGLMLGKFIGILSFCWIMVKLGLASLPKDTHWKHIIGVALLAGIGFTMSLFISGLAFKNPEFIDQAKYGILIASLTAGTLGTIVLRRIGGSPNN